MGEFERPNSEQLVDLHIYIVPPDLWRTQLQSAKSHIIDDTISAGFIRVYPDDPVHLMRDEIKRQIEYENPDLPIPDEYVFLKSVGRCLTQVKPRQEYTLKIKTFQPPQLYASEIFILDATAAGIRFTPFSGSSSQSSSVRYNGTPRSDRSEFSGHKPIPPIGQSSQTDPETQNSPANILITNPSSATNKATQYSRPPTPYRPTPDGRDRNAPNFSERFEQIESPLQNGSQRQKHVVFKSPTPTNEAGRPLTPLSATPTNSPEPLFNGGHPGQHKGTDPYLPPLSATPPSSADQDRNGANYNNSYPQHTPPRHNKDKPESHSNSRTVSRERGAPTKPDQSNVSDGPRLSEEEQRKLDELLKQKRKKPHRRQQEQAANDSAAQAEAERKRRQREAEDERRRKQQEEDLRRKKEEEDEERRRQEEEEEETKQREEEQTRQQQEEEEEEEEEERRRQEEEDRKQQEAEKRRNTENEKRRKEEDSQQRRRSEQEERKRKLQDERRKQEEEERRRREEEEEEERRRQEEEDEEERRRQEEEDNSLDDRDSRGGSLGGRSLTELREELERTRQERLDAEHHREELVKKARQLQTRTQKKRNQARDAWKKKYFEEKKKTSPLEEQCNKLRNELELLHRKIMSQLETSKDPAKRTGDNKPSQQSNLKIQATKLQHEIDELQRRVENIKMKLTTEMKLRNQAQGELKALRAELTQKKINMSLHKTSHPHHPLAHTPAPMLTPRS